MDGNLFDKKTKFYAVHREKIAPILFRKWTPRRNWKYVNTMSTKELKTEYAGGDNMCTCAVFFCKDTSLWYFLLLWFATSTYIAMCLSVRDKIDRTAATWMSGCFLRKETLQTHERYWQKLAFCLFMFIRHNCKHLTIMNFCNSQTKLAGSNFEVFLHQVNSHWKVWWIYQD